jgi:hypothetical protein
MAAFRCDRNRDYLAGFGRSNDYVQVRFVVIRIAGIKGISAGKHLAHIRQNFLGSLHPMNFLDNCPYFPIFHSASLKDFPNRDGNR